MRDNIAEVTLAGNTYRVESSLGACKVYADEFFGTLKAPYKGALAEDMLQLMQRQEGTIVPDESEPDGIRLIPGVNALDEDMIERLLSFVWSMGSAADSIEVPYDEFHDWAMHADISFFEMSEAYQTIIHTLGDGATFRLPKGLSDALAPDQAQEVEGR